ncbi:MAG: GAF domain-containing protein, partial [Planctomycetales bacterium]|nr:GAF domain-containing protein [Planctomycetales bacterium]
MSTEQPVDPQAVEETKQQIRGLVAEITQLSRQNLDPTVFYGEFLQRVITALAAVGGAVWLRSGNAGLELMYQINLRQSLPGDDGEDQMRHARLLHTVVTQNQELLVPPYSGAAGETEAGNPTAYLLVLAPLCDDQKPVGVVEIFQRPTSGPASQRGYLRFLTEMCTLVGDYLKGRRLRQLNDWQTLFMEAERFSRMVHETLDPRETAYTIANEGRRLIGVDRVSVAIRRGRNGKIEAISGQDTMDTRANTVTLLGKLATAVMRSGETLWYTGSSHDLPPQIETAVHAYVDESHSKSVAVLPLREPSSKKQAAGNEDSPRDELQEGEVIGALVIEQIEDSRPPEEFAQSVELVADHSARALANALEHHSLFLMPIWRAIGKAQWMIQARTLPKTIAISAAVLAAILAMIFVPWRFEMKSPGYLQPIDRREVFVRADGGVVTQVHVKHAQHVDAGAPLVDMYSRDLDLEIQPILTEIDTTREELRQLEESRTRARRDPTQQAEYHRLSARLLPLKAKLQGLGEQLEQYNKKREALHVTSPITGVVEDYDVDKKLEQRPVTRGQILMTIANPDGEWELILHMPEDRMGHIAQWIESEAARGNTEPLKVRFVVATNPGEDLTGTVREIRATAEMDEEHGHGVRIVVDVDE